MKTESFCAVKEITNKAKKQFWKYMPAIHLRSALYPEHKKNVNNSSKKSKNSIQKLAVTLNRKFSNT